MQPFKILLGLGMASRVLGHMMMKYPLPRGAPQNTAYGRPDYNLKSPLDAAFVCGGKPPGRPTASFRAGDTIKVQFEGVARHGGGICQFSLSYDNDKTFVVIQQIDGACPDENYAWPVKLPDNLPNCDRCTFAWTWINAVGNLNCADVSINGGRGSLISGAKLLVANLPGYQSIYPRSRDGGPTASSFKHYGVNVH